LIKGLTDYNYGYIFITERSFYKSKNFTMPKFDGTGPLGYGPMTGRGMGPCRFGTGGGFGWGYGRGFERRFFTRKEEKEELEEEMKDLEKELEAVKERLQELEGQK